MPDTLYKLFLDDSGTKEYDESRNYSTTGGATPYFLFGGILATPGTISQMVQAVRGLKKATFGDSEVEIKANWLRVQHERERRYLQAFRINDESLRQMVTQVYGVIADADCVLLAAIVNKREVQEGYEKPHYAPAIAYECVMQRAQLAMSELAGRVHVTIDDMSGKTPKGSEYKQNLERHHARMRSNGSILRPGMLMDRLEGISFRDSKADQMLQLADLVSYAVYRQFVDHGIDWERPGKALPIYEYLQPIVRRFRHDGNGRVQGYGIVKFPLKTRVPWGVAVRAETEPNRKEKRP